MTTAATSQPTAPTDRRPLLGAGRRQRHHRRLAGRAFHVRALPHPGHRGAEHRPGRLALAIAIQNLVWGLGQPVAAIADRFGAPRVLAVGGGLYALGVLGMSRASTTTELYLSGGLLVGVAMAAASFSVVLAAVGRIASPERRTWARGTATAAGSLGQFILVPLAGQLEDAFGWRSALAALGSVALVAIALAPVLRLRTPAAGTAAAAEAAAAEPLGMALRRALRHPSYVLLCAGFFVCGFHVTFIGTHLPAYLGDVGLSKATGARRWR
ncbi:MAG: MFS transporter [Acidimicrobiales bacterium]